MNDYIDLFLSANSPCEVDKFYQLFGAHLRKWSSRLERDHELPLTYLDVCNSYAKHVNIDSTKVQNLLSGDDLNIPGEVLREMRLRITKSRVLVPQERSVLTRDNEATD